MLDNEYRSSSTVSLDDLWAVIVGVYVQICRYTSIVSKSLQCPCRDDGQAATVKRTIRHGDHFPRKARAANKVVRHDQFATVTTF